MPCLDGCEHRAKQKCQHLPRGRSSSASFFFFTQRTLLDISAETCWRATAGVASVARHFNMFTRAQTAGNKPQPVWQKNNNMTGNCLNHDKESKFHWQLGGSKKNRGKRRFSESRERNYMSAEPLWVSMWMQVVMYPWVHESSSIKCQPVNYIFHSHVSPLVIDVTGQFWHKLKELF